MKKLLLVLFFIPLLSNGQNVPQGINYQAIARDSSGSILVDQNIKIKILNVYGAELHFEEKENFVGEYTKQIDLNNYPKGIYLLEIKTEVELINKKLILH